jgi:hypothetical protein
MTNYIFMIVYGAALAGLTGTTITTKPYETIGMLMLAVIALNINDFKTKRRQRT